MQSLIKASIAVFAFGYSVSAHSQTGTFPYPSRMVYKCEVAGKVVYSGEPCQGARKLDIAPSRGLNKSTGRELTGSDVTREKHREMTGEALKPLTGKTP